MSQVGRVLKAFVANRFVDRMTDFVVWFPPDDRRQDFTHPLDGPARRLVEAYLDPALILARPD